MKVNRQMSVLISCFLVICLGSFYALNAQQSSNVRTYTYPRISPRNSDFKMKADGKDVFVYNTSAAPFAAFTCSGAVEIEMDVPATAQKISIAPRRYNIVPVVSGNKVRFAIPGPMMLVLEFDGMPQLFIYANAPEKNIPDPNSPNVKYFKAGQVYEVGMLTLKDNETLYIEEGAVVRGCVRSVSSKNVRISGYGVLDGGYYTRGIDGQRTIIFKNCRHSVIENIIMIEPQTWMIVLAACEYDTVRNVKELGLCSGSDGTDIVGSSHILIENCCYRNGDDCVVVKSINMRESDTTVNSARDVDDIEIRGCTFVAYSGGTVLEIGHELRTASVKNIRFINCDILGSHGFGGVFGIHNADRATVSDVLYENIRVEHYYNKLIDLKVIKSMWGKDEQRGQIRNVTFRNIQVSQTIFNSGYSTSLIGGYDAAHTVENVTFENFTANGVKILNADQIELYTKQTKGLKFK